MDIHVFCFVDDYLLVGDTRELTVLAMQMFMDLVNELGLPFAPHKTRGPARGSCWVPAKSRPSDTPPGVISPRLSACGLSSSPPYAASYAHA